MNIFYSAVEIVVLLLFIAAFIKVYSDNKIKTKRSNLVKTITRIGIFGGISTILYIVPLFKFPVPIFPSFLEFHFDEIPLFIAGFAYGPLVAFGSILVKTIIKLPFTGTMLVGELSDLLFSTAFVLPSAIIYKKMRNIKGAILGLLLGSFIQIVISVIGNIYVMVPFYMFMYGMSAEQLLFICQLANPNISDVGWTYGLIAVLPFNVIKDAIVILATFLIYKSSHKLIDNLQ